MINVMLVRFEGPSDLRSSPLLPPLPSLRVFQAVARRLSFRLAGEELLITQSAVSHHIKQLEDALGTRLFRRKSKSIELTENGAIYLATVDQALSLLAAGTADLRARSGRSTLRVSLLPSFAANWLVSRLGRFQKEYPNIELILDPTIAVVDVFRGDADVAIRFGDFGMTRAGAVHLANEELVPIMSPALYGDGSKLHSPQDLLQFPLLQAKRGHEWLLWGEAAQLSISAARQVQLTDYNIVLQAALDGQGVAIGRRLLVDEHIRSGRLVRPFAISSISEKAAYFAVFDTRSNKLKDIELFVNWLKAELEV